MASLSNSPGSQHPLFNAAPIKMGAVPACSMTTACHLWLTKACTTSCGCRGQHWWLSCCRCCASYKLWCTMPASYSFLQMTLPKLQPLLPLLLPLSRVQPLQGQGLMAQQAQQMLQVPRRHQMVVVRGLLKAILLQQVTFATRHALAAFPGGCTPQHVLFVQTQLCTDLSVPTLSSFCPNEQVQKKGVLKQRSTHSCV